MLVQKYMTRNPVTISPDAPIIDATHLMQQHNIGFLPVVDGRQLIGTLTDRDIVVRCLARDLDPHSTPVYAAMTTGIITCQEDEDLEDAAEIMEEHQVRRLIVVDWKKRLAGVLSLGDLATHCEDESLPGEVVKYVSTKPIALRKIA